MAGPRYIGKPQVAYSAAKAGNIGFTKNTSVFYAKKGTRVNMVVLGLIDTPLVRLIVDRYANGDYEGIMTQRHAQVTMGKM